MFNKFLLGSALAAAIVFTGCSSKSPTVDTTTSKTEPTSSTSTDSSSTTVAPAVSSTSSTSDVSTDAFADAQSKIQAVLFDFDKFNIRADMQSIVDANSKVVASLSQAKVKLEGNADERGSDEYNYALGLKRANSVKTAYASKGVSDAAMSVVTFGEGNPVCKESSEECWAKNRRVDTKFEK